MVYQLYKQFPNAIECLKSKEPITNKSVKCKFWFVSTYTSYLSQPQFESKKIYTVCKDVFSRSNWKFYAWLKIFTQPVVVMVVTNIRCA